MRTAWNDAPAAFHPASAPDYLPRAQLEALQLGRLQAVVRRAYERVPLFRERMDALHLGPEDVKALPDLADKAAPIEATMEPTSVGTSTTASRSDDD